LPGECYVTGYNELLSTILGSCVSACVRDPRTGVGGMNHFMLPEPGAGSDPWGGVAGRATRYGSAAMEELINAVLKAGGLRRGLEVKIFGGGRVLARVTDIGRRNLEFVEHYLATEKLAVAARDVGEGCAREVRYFPHSGAARVRRLKRHDRERVAVRERGYRKQLAAKPVAGAIELFGEPS
jgi:chemotaxis protein CheD